MVNNLPGCFQPTAAAMFEHACSDRIRQFDATDSDEELWDDKEMTFTRLSDIRHRCVVVWYWKWSGTGNGSLYYSGSPCLKKL